MGVAHVDATKLSGSQSYLSQSSNDYTHVTYAVELRRAGSSRGSSAGSVGGSPECSWRRGYHIPHHLPASPSPASAGGFPVPWRLSALPTPADRGAALQCPSAPRYSGSLAMMLLVTQRCAFTAGNNRIIPDTEKVFWNHLFLFCSCSLLLETDVSFQIFSYSPSYCFLWRNTPHRGFLLSKFILSCQISGGFFLISSFLSIFLFS